MSSYIPEFSSESGSSRDDHPASCRAIRHLNKKPSLQEKLLSHDAIRCKVTIKAHGTMHACMHAYISMVVMVHASIGSKGPAFHTVLPPRDACSPANIYLRHEDRSINFRVVFPCSASCIHALYLQTNCIERFFQM